jgi:hypothetical protein
MKQLSIIIAASTLFACGGASPPQSFEPSERATSTSPQGYTAAEYELGTSQGDIGDVKVWSRGAQVMDLQGTRITAVHVGFEVENNAGQPIELRELALDSAMLDRQILRDIEPARIDGPMTIAPGQVSQIDAYFPMPRGIEPRDVDAFRVRWQVRDDSVTYAQHTPFTESRDEAVVYYYTPYYDPFYYDRYYYHPRIIVHRYPYRHYHGYHPPRVIDRRSVAGRTPQ